MSDSKEKKVSSSPIRIYERTLRALKEAQYAEWLKRSMEPSYAELIDRAWLSYGEKNTNTPINTTEVQAQEKGVALAEKRAENVLTSGLTTEELQKVEALVSLLRTGDDELMPILDGVLGVAQIRHAKHAATKKAAGKSDDDPRATRPGRRRTG